MRLLGASAATAVLGLGTAGHAFASGSFDPSTAGTPASAMAIPGASEPEPPPIPGPDPFVPGLVPNPGPGPVAGPSTTPGIEPPPVSSLLARERAGARQLTAKPAPTPPEITTTTDSDGGNLNVSVRIDSPGADGPVTQENGDGSVVSPPTPPDITPAEPVAGSRRARSRPGAHAPAAHPIGIDEHERFRAGPEPRRQRSGRPGQQRVPAAEPAERRRRLFERLGTRCGSDSRRIRRSITTIIRSINPAILLDGTPGVEL